MLACNESALNPSWHYILLKGANGLSESESESILMSQKPRNLYDTNDWTTKTNNSLATWWMETSGDKIFWFCL